MTLLDSWMPSYDVAARYVIRIGAPPSRVYATLLTADFSRLWVVRALMGVRRLPDVFRAPGGLWQRLGRVTRIPRASLADLACSDFVMLEQQPPRELVFGITGRFWALSPTVARVPPATFREPLNAGLAQAAWSFEITETPEGAALATETRVRTADPLSRRQFRRYWRVIAPGSGLIRHAMLRQIRREAEAAAD